MRGSVGSEGGGGKGGCRFCFSVCAKVGWSGIGGECMLEKMV